jgi:hypothetical protein
MLPPAVMGTDSLADLMKLVFSAGSLGITAYFWFVRVNRERVSVGLFPAYGFEGTLESGGIGVWTGRLFLSNRSILPTAIISGEVELWWKKRWLKGRFYANDGHELPWNLPPSEVFVKTVSVAFDLGENTPRERVYAKRRLRFTFITVEGHRVAGELPTHAVTEPIRTAA